MITTYNNHNALQNYLAIRKDPMALIADVMRTSGDFSRFNILFYRYIFVNEPDLIREALIEKHDTFIIKDGTVSGLARLIGHGILTNHGEAWRCSRNHVQPLFQQKALETYYAIIRERVQESLARWKTLYAGKSFSINRELLALTFRIICSTLFQYVPDFEESLVFADAMWILQTEGMIRFTNGGDLLPWAPLPRIRKVNKAVSTLKQISTNIIASGCRIPLDEIRALLFAGTESPANTLCWSLILLENSPQWQEKLTKADLSNDTMDRFDVISQVLCETMRLYPPGWAFERYTCEDTTLGGEPVAKGTRLFFSPYYLHRNENFWKEPEVFNPDRFTNSATVVPGIPKYGYIPFGAGPRSCIGGRMAWAELRIILSMILTQCRWQIVRQDGEAPLSPQGSFKMKLNRPLFINLSFTNALQSVHD